MDLRTLHAHVIAMLAAHPAPWAAATMAHGTTPPPIMVTDAKGGNVLVVIDPELAATFVALATHLPLLLDTLMTRQPVAQPTQAPVSGPYCGCSVRGCPARHQR